MNPRNYTYTQEHEWICLDGNEARVGLTNYAQKQLGDIVYVNFPAPGTQVQQFKEMGEIESLKAVAEFFAPASGKILQVNESVVDRPQLVNEDPYGSWLAKVEISNKAELDKLMDCDQYDAFEAKLMQEQEQGGHQ